eukprot:IDg4516t1
MSNFGVVSTISAPVLESVTQPSLIQFETEYKLYQEKIADINRTRDKNKKIEPASLKNCIEPLLLNSLCILGKIEGASKAQQATEEAVLEWFDSRLRSAPHDLAERVRSAVDSVKYEQCSEDPAGAALTFTLNVVKALERGNASEVITDKERCKGLIIKLTNKLEPSELKERIRNAREFWSTDEKSSLSFFQERISAIAVDVSLGEIARARLKRRAPTKSTDIHHGSTFEN